MLLNVHLFNLGGYHFVFQYLINQSDVQIVKQIYEKKKGRGMSYMTDIRDWLGGWPMEFADDQAVIDFLKKRFDFELVRISTGEACTEFLFRDPTKPPSERN